MYLAQHHTMCNIDEITNLDTKQYGPPLQEWI